MKKLIVLGQPLLDTVQDLRKAIANDYHYSEVHRARVAVARKPEAYPEARAHLDALRTDSLTTDAGVIRAALHFALGHPDFKASLTMPDLDLLAKVK